MADSERDVSKALTAFGAPPLKYRSFAHAAIQPPPEPPPVPAAPPPLAALAFPARPPFAPIAAPLPMTVPAQPVAPSRLGDVVASPVSPSPPVEPARFPAPIAMTPAGHTGDVPLAELFRVLAARLP